MPPLHERKFQYIVGARRGVLHPADWRTPPRVWYTPVDGRWNPRLTSPVGHAVAPGDEGARLRHDRQTARREVTGPQGELVESAERPPPLESAPSLAGQIQDSGRAEATLKGVRPKSCPEWPEERSNVFGQELRLLHRGEVPGARHLGPPRDVEEPLGPLAGREEILREDREPGGTEGERVHCLSISTTQVRAPAFIAS